MFSKVIRNIDSGFVGRRGNAVRPSVFCDFLYDHLEIKKDRDVYFCRLGMFMQDVRSGAGNGHMGLNLPDFGLTKSGVGVMPDFFDEAVSRGYSWKDTDARDLSEALKDHSISFFSFWGAPENCVDYLRYAQGEPKPKNLDVYQKYGLSPHRCATNAMQLGLLFAYLGERKLAEIQFYEYIDLALSTDTEAAQALDLLRKGLLRPEPHAFPFADLLVR